MRPGDGQEVTRIWSKVLPDDENWADWLPGVIDTLLENHLIIAGVLMVEGSQPRCAAVGVSCFLPDEIAADFVANPLPYLNRRLLTRYRDGDQSVFLNREQQASGNSGDGLEMFVLEYFQETFDFSDDWAHQLLNSIVPVYHSAHRGFNIKRTMHETEIAVGHIQIAGGNPMMFEVSPQDAFSLSANAGGPRAVYGISRDDALGEPATGISKVLLYYTPPEIKLNLRQQEIVLLALEDMTDVEIAERLGISRDGVRQHWRAIYDRLEDVKPGFYEHLETEAGKTRRGSEKRRQTLSFLGSRPQELRPYRTRGNRLARPRTDL